MLIMNPIIGYFKGVWLELKKVSWPTSQTVINHTIIVIVATAVAMSFTALADFGLTKLIQFIIQNKS